MMSQFRPRPRVTPWPCAVLSPSLGTTRLWKWDGDPPKSTSQSTTMLDWLQMLPKQRKFSHW